MACRRAAPFSLVAMLTLSACGDRSTDLVLNRVPARTDLHQASTLPPESVRTVSRKDYGWRLIYHPSRAPAGAGTRAGAALCALERRRVAGIDPIPRTDPTADPGAVILDIHCA